MPFAAANPSHLPTPSHPLAEFHGHLILLMWHDIYEERQESFMGCERSFIPMKLIWLGYLVFALGNCVMKLCIETYKSLPS